MSAQTCLYVTCLYAVRVTMAIHVSVIAVHAPHAQGGHRIIQRTGLARWFASTRRAMLHLMGYLPQHACFAASMPRRSCTRECNTNTAQVHACSSRYAQPMHRRQQAAALPHNQHHTRPKGLSSSPCPCHALSKLQLCTQHTKCTQVADQLHPFATWAVHMHPKNTRVCNRQPIDHMCCADGAPSHCDAGYTMCTRAAAAASMLQHPCCWTTPSGPPSLEQTNQHTDVQPTCSNT